MRLLKFLSSRMRAAASEIALFLLKTHSTRASSPVYDWVRRPMLARTWSLTFGLSML